MFFATFPSTPPVPSAIAKINLLTISEISILLDVFSLIRRAKVIICVNNSGDSAMLSYFKRNEDNSGCCNILFVVICFGFVEDECKDKIKEFTRK